MFPATDFRIDYAQMDPGDILYLYTDGVTEARDPGRAFFTEKRLLALIGQPAGSAAGLLERVDASLRQFMAGAAQFDDITMLAVQRLLVSER
jgi:sigma-B regulation protein RsbU (phosphoserine phosphatase)